MNIFDLFKVTTGHFPLYVPPGSLTGSDLTLFIWLFSCMIKINKFFLFEFQNRNRFLNENSDNIFTIYFKSNITFSIEEYNFILAFIHILISFKLLSKSPGRSREPWLIWWARPSNCHHQGYKPSRSRPNILSIFYLSEYNFLELNQNFR